MSDEFNVRALVRAVHHDLATGDKALIAKEAASRIPRGRRDEALLQALAEVARAVVNQEHPRLGAVPPAGAGQVNSARSQKVAGIRDAWRKHLNAVYVSVDPDRQIGDYGADDLLNLAAMLEKKAAEHAAKAARFRSLAPLLAEHGAERVRDLPDDVLAAVFGGAEAAA